GSWSRSGSPRSCGSRHEGEDMRQVKCVSPHGGIRGGDKRKNIAPAADGYVDNAVLGLVRVGDTVTAPDPPAFIADGFHFADAATGKADECAAPGDGCWCGQHRTPPVPEDIPAPPGLVPAKPAPPQPASTPPAAAGEGK